MAERYTRLFSLAEDLYVPGAPLVISAGALLKDGQTAQVLVQLKLRSISEKTISAVKLEVFGYDMSKTEICREEHQYLDLSVTRDESFGSKEAIPLPNHAVRSFTVRVLAVYFTDGTRYAGPDALWQPLPVQEDLVTRLYDTELIRQYRIDTSERSRFVPMDCGDLWLCACGEINHKGEYCFRCGQIFEDTMSLLNIDLLKANKAKRLEDEEERAREAEKRKNSLGYRLRRVLLILIPLLLIAGAAIGVYVYSAHRAAAYEQAVELLASGEYGAAAAAFERLGNYRDAARQASAARVEDAQLSTYTRAGKLLANGRYDDAVELYETLGDYRDSAELVLEARYRKGLELIEVGVCDEALALFTELGDYRDSAEIAAHFFPRLILEELSWRADLDGPVTTRCSYDGQGRLAARTELLSAYPGREDQTHVYEYGSDGGWLVRSGQLLMRYDAHGNLLGQGDVALYTYEYSFYEGGGVQYCFIYDAETGEYRGSSAYDTHGNCIGTENEDGVGYVLRNEYEGERLVRQERYDTSGTLLERTSYEYREDGQLKRSSMIVPGASSAVTTNYSYGLIYAPEASE